MSTKTQNEQNDTIVSDQKVDNPAKTNDNIVVLGEQEFNLALIDQSMSNVSSGQIVDGKVVSLDDKEVLVDIGCKSEAAIPLNEFTPENMPEKGDIIKVYVVSRARSDGKPILSKKRADLHVNLKRIKEAHQNNEVIIAKAIRRVKSGLIVDVMGVEAFLPGSLIDTRPSINYDHFLNKEIKVYIIKIDEQKNSYVVSRKQVLENEKINKKAILKDIIKINAELDGEVKNMTEYGAFVDLGGIDGLLHIADMSYKKIKNPSELLKVGDKIKVKVLGYDEENARVSLGIKQLVPHPWENIVAKYPEGIKITGKVIHITNYGIFVELEPGVEGLIHATEISWTKRVIDPTTVCKEGDMISAIVLYVSKENQKISLGLKQMLPNPWVDIEKHYPVGSVLTRKIKSITSFGIFVEIESDIVGLVHISDISWTKKIYHPKEVFKKDQTIDAVILDIDKLARRFSLGIKQLKNDPWENIFIDLPVNTEVIGKVTKCLPKGILVDIEHGDSILEGFVPISHLAIPMIEKTSDVFNVNELLNMKIIEIEEESRRLILSIKAWYYSRDIQLMKDYQKAHIKKKENEEEQKDKTKKRSRRRSHNKRDRKKTNNEAIQESPIETVTEDPSSTKTKKTQNKEKNKITTRIDVEKTKDTTQYELIEKVKIEEIILPLIEVNTEEKPVKEKKPKKTTTDEVKPAKEKKTKKTTTDEVKPVKEKKTKETTTNEVKPVKEKKTKKTTADEEKPVKEKKTKKTTTDEEKPVKERKTKKTTISEENPVKEKKTKK